MAPRRNFDSFIQFETERLLLRQPRLRDAGAIAKFWKDEQNFLEPYEPKLGTERTKAIYWRQRFLEDRIKARKQEALRLFLYEKANPSLPRGMIHISQIYHGWFQAGYLGYFLAENAQGKGFMTEALRAACAFVFDQWNLHRLMANHLPENTKSAAVLERLSFQKDGVAKDYLLIAGSWRDHVLTSLINSSWKSPTKSKTPRIGT